MVRGTFPAVKCVGVEAPHRATLCKPCGADILVTSLTQKQLSSPSYSLDFEEPERGFLYYGNNEIQSFASQNCGLGYTSVILGGILNIRG